jgi:hypothetical protein
MRRVTACKATARPKEGDIHPDRDAQFTHINTQVAAALAEQQPVISVDTKKKELVGDSRNNSYRVIVELISATTTKTGLTVRCELDTGQYSSRIVVSDAEMAAINIKRAESLIPLRPGAQNVVAAGGGSC